MLTLLHIFTGRCGGGPAASIWLAILLAMASPMATAESSAAALWQRLQQPGKALYVVFLRHALAPGIGDPANFSLQDCSTQRNLSAEGRTQARQIGQAFEAQGVEVRLLLSSQWCRCLETAELMSVGRVTAFASLNSFFRNRRMAASRTADIEQYLLSQLDHPGVIVMVSHQVNITALTDIVPRSGTAVVVQVTASGLVPLGQLDPAG